MARPAPQTRLEVVEAWWPLLARMTSFGLGSGIMFWQTVIESADRPYLIAGALGLMGLPVANIVGKLLTATQPDPPSPQRTQE